MSREAGAQRVARTVEAWAGPYAARTRYGEVHLDRLEHHQDGRGNQWVEVWAGGDTASGDPHFRIFNPPTLVQDPLGTTELEGVRYREDPMAALAEAVARHGGALKSRRGRRRTRG